MAIALDLGTNGGYTSGTSHTFSHTCTGSNLILFVHVVKNDTVDNVTGVTYNSVAMTQIYKGSNTTGSRYVYLYYLINPATGAHNVVISASSSSALGGNAISYTGAKQSSQPDAYDRTLDDTSPATVTITTVADNCWTILVTCGSTPTAGAGCTLRVTNGTFGDAKIFDSNGPITPAGETSMTVTSAGNNTNIMASFSPYVAAGLTNVKTVNGLAIASVKTVNGLAIASVKSIQGLT